MTPETYRTVSLEIKDGIYNRIINGYSSEEQLNQVVKQGIKDGSLTKEEAAKLNKELIEHLKKLKTKRLNI
jgi:polyhydroxyalkanoate synthesis regulator phasin